MHASNVLHDHRAVLACVAGDASKGSFERAAKNVDTGQDVASRLNRVERRRGVDEGNPTTRDDAFLDGGSGRAQRVLDPVLLLLELSLGRGADLDHGNATGELRESLLELFAIKVRGGVLDLGADLRDASLDIFLGTLSVNERGVVLGGDHTSGGAEIFLGDAVELATDLFRDHASASQRGDVAEHFLAAVTEARRLDREGLEAALKLIDDEGGQRFAIDILGKDDERLALAGDHLDRRQDVSNRRNLLVSDENEGILEVRLHALRAGHEVWGDISAVDLHALGELGLELKSLGLLDRDHAVLADTIHDFGDHLTDFRVCGGVGGDLRDLLLALDLGGHLTNASN